VNPAFTQTTGYSLTEALGQNPRILKSASTPPEHYRSMWETLARGEVWSGEFENQKKNGEPFFERAIIAPVRDDAGVVINYIAIKEDITDQKRQEVARQAMEAQLHQAQRLESVGSLAGGVAHDMNNVLGAILGLASTMREKAERGSADWKGLDTIVSACLRGRGVVKSLLYFAKRDLQEELPTDLSELTREVAQLLSATTLKRVELRLDLAENLGLLRGDPGALSHAIMNLCLNAIDAMPRGGTLFLETVQEAEGGLILRVRDTGEGMPPEVAARAMEPFFTTKPQGKGTGLGLPMVFGTVSAHEGSFTLASRPGQGTEAMLRFPASRVSPRVPANDPTPAMLASGPSGMGVLLVDDDELIREAVVPLLEVLGYAVTAAANGTQALARLQEGLKVDLVILDMNMPGLSGAETLPRILDLRPGLAVIMATGYSDHEVAPLLEGRTSVTSIRKPFSLKELQLKIASLQIQQTPKL
jgi:PAS domain S-box-containing protein